jgi:uncharacterized protein (DUF885 family)
LDLDEAYAWGWDELRWIGEDRARTAAAVLPGGTFADALHHLDHGGSPAAESPEEFRDWIQRETDETIAWFNGRHLDIPDPLHRCEAMLAPQGGALGAHYTTPSNDFTVPGRTWWSIGTQTRIPLWSQLTVCYHEGVPGHHLQLAWARYLGDRLPSIQRFSEAGNALVEGWALYAERFMDEVGRFEQPGFRLGFLASQALRAARVVVDIGLHLGLRIPDDQPFHPGEQWTPALAVEFVEGETGEPNEFVVSEIVRYLGLPGQALCYKLGERAWLDGREAARQRHGDEFDLKAFHGAALDLGILGLDQLRDELARL